MAEQILLNSGSFDGMRETGGFGQPLHALYPQIRAVLAAEMGPEAGLLLAEPVVDRAGNRIDWYAEGDPDCKPVALSELPDEQRQPHLARVREWLERGREVAERYAGSGDAHRAQLGAILKAVLNDPADTQVFVVEGRPMITGWGFTPDRPWDLPGEPVGNPLIPPPVPARLARDVAIPEIAMPDLATAVPEPAPASEPSPARQPVPEPVPESAPKPPPLPGPAPVAGMVETASSLPPPELPPSRKTPPPAVGALPVSEPVPVAPLRYVVVGSRYFWGVVALAVLLALVAALWLGMEKSSSPHPVTGDAPRWPVVAESDNALAEAQRTGAVLQARLEQLLVRLAERRGQCLPPAGTGATTPAGREPVVGVTATPGLEPVPPARVGTPPSPQPAVPAPAANPPPNLNTGSLDRAGSPPAASTSGPSPGVAASGRTLEDVLAGREPVPPAPSGITPPAELPPGAKPSPGAESPVKAAPPVKAEPTPEERREFASRLSAAGAATGEITATLLWNTQGDLDLVVRCPSGRQLDYRNPAQCGGTLDVDANASRASLSDRPVENAFWPAGKAEPGVYEVAVRYAPRKDEQAPRETPFQVRLARNSQESVFKGTVRPNALVPVTTFAVER